MIPRYSDPKIDEIWSDDHKYQLWARIELAHLQALDENAGRTQLEYGDGSRGPINYKVEIPDARTVRTREGYTGHEMGAFLELLEENLDDPRHMRYLHYGLTSSNVIDTADAMRVNDTTANLCARYEVGLYDAIRNGKFEVEVQGYTHGQRAEPTTIAHRFKAAHVPFNGFEIPTLPASLAGAVGRGLLAPKIQKDIASKLGMKLCMEVTQVLPRWRFSQALWLWMQFIHTCEQIAMDVRLMSAFGDVHEPAQKVGSTAMPHKTNPIRSERVCGLAKYARGMFAAALEAQSLWLDRDLTHSSVDRLVFPDLANLTAFMLSETVDLLDGLVVHPTEPQEGSAAELARWQDTFDEPRSISYKQIREHYHGLAPGRADIDHA